MDMPRLWQCELGEQNTLQHAQLRETPPRLSDGRTVATWELDMSKMRQRELLPPDGMQHSHLHGAAPRAAAKQCAQVATGRDEPVDKLALPTLR